MSEGGYVVPIHLARLFEHGGYVEREKEMPGKDMELIRRLAHFIGRFRFDLTLRLGHYLYQQTIFNWLEYVPPIIGRRREGAK